jgi:hypothetical protein
MTNYGRSRLTHQTRPSLLWAFAFLSTTGTADGRVDQGLLLADAGKALQPIVVSPKASSRVKAVADEVAGFLTRITGATFQVEVDDGSRGIVLGTLAEFPDPALAGPLAIRNGFDGREAFAIRTEPNRVRLVGATDLGASHAAFAFLEAIGCRWFFPAPEWEAIPSIPTLRVNVHMDDRPAIPARRIWYGYGFFEHGPQAKAVKDYEAWARRNRMAQSFGVNAGHAWQTIIDDHRALFAAHPEYRALNGGKRQGEQLCVSNPAVRKIAVDWALDYLRKNPSAEMVSMDCSDGDGQCECPECKRMGSVSDRVFGLANEAARAVAETHPGKMVGILAYNEHCEPPSFALELNVHVQLTAGFIRGRYRFDELLELWPKKCKNLGLYEYFSVWLWDFDRLPGGNGANVARMKTQIPRYAAHGATSLDCESGNNWGLHGRGYYVAQKLMWNPNADVDAILGDFYSKAFGPAAAPIKRYYERFDPGNQPLMSEHLLALGFRDVEEASRLAGGRADVQARLDHLKQYLRYVHLRWLVDREADKAKKKGLTLAALTHAYRTRYSYMNHWEAIRQGWTGEAAKEFGEPTWSFNKPVKQLWAVDRPYSREETETAFREGLEYFKTETIDEQSFSDDLVPVAFPTNAPPAESVQTYQYGLRYSLYCIGGEPLSLTVTPGTIAWYRDRAPARWSIADATGKRIAHGELPLDGKPHAIDVKVPKAGRYDFECDDSGAGWQIKVAAGKPASIALERGRTFHHAGWMQPMHFYVPKGTKELQYYWAGGPHWVHGPDGGKLKRVETSGKFVRVPVPAGADGKTWSFSELALGHLWFFNAPNRLAATPASLLIPKELADRDGLQRRFTVVLGRQHHLERRTDPADRHLRGSRRVDSAVTR